jgi:hypothetical protein
VSFSSLTCCSSGDPVHGVQKVKHPICPVQLAHRPRGGVKNVKGVVTVTNLCLVCQRIEAPVSTGPAPGCCAICEESDGPFPEASPWEDSVAPPAICVACIEQSLLTMHIGEHRTESATDDFSVSNSQTENHRNSLRYLPCVVCHRSRLASTFPHGHVVESCRHEPDVCLDCIEKAIAESLDHDLPHYISCPQCGDAMSSIDVWRLSSTGTFAR